MATRLTKSTRKPASRKQSSPVRSTAVPKARRTASPVSHDQIACRAYEIYASGQGGSEIDNWLRAERELRRG